MSKRPAASGKSPRSNRPIPVAQGYAPPPNWPRPAPQNVPPPNPRPRKKRRQRRFLTTQVKTLLIVVMAIGCMGLGWYLFNGPLARAKKGNSASTEVASITPDASPAESPKEPTSRKAPPAAPETKKTPETSVKPAEPPPMTKPPDPPPKPTEPAKPPEGQTAAVTFEKHILPIFEAKCIRCHGATKMSKGIDVRTVPAMLKGGEKGPILVPGSPAQSSLWTSVAKDEMPPNKANKLTPNEKSLLQNWISSGAKSGGNSVAQAEK